METCGCLKNQLRAAVAKEHEIKTDVEHLKKLNARLIAQCEALGNQLFEHEQKLKDKGMEMSMLENYIEELYDEVRELRMFRARHAFRPIVSSTPPVSYLGEEGVSVSS